MCVCVCVHVRVCVHHFCASLYILMVTCVLICPCSSASLQWSQVDTHCAPCPRLDVAMCAVTLPNRHKDGGAPVLFIFGGVDTNGQLFDDCYVIHCDM